MQRNAGRFTLLTLGLGLALSACTEQRPDPTAVETDVPQANLIASIASCGLTTPITDDVKNYFSNPDRQTAQAHARDLSKACSDGNVAGVRNSSRALLGMVRDAVNDNRRGDTATGARLVTNLLACLHMPCTTATTFPAVEDALLRRAMTETSGLFVLSAGESNQALARGRVAFSGLTAQWGTTISGGNWPADDALQIMLLYGAPAAGSGTSLKLAYDIKRWPHGAAYPLGGTVAVGACFYDATGPAEFVVPDPHPRNVGLRVKRNSGGQESLLPDARPAFCPVAGASADNERLLSASIIAPVFAVARSFRLTSAAVAMTDVGVRHVGGSATDFSNFDALDISTLLPLSWAPENVHPTVVKPGENFTLVALAAAVIGNSSVPVPGASARVFVYNNSGVPAGAETQGQTTGVTGHDGKVSFTINITKTGGYTVCVEALQTGYTFEQVCTPLFHVRR
jgi:hypothetical protein